MNIFVTKLNYDTSDESLRYAFEEFGEVSSAKIIFDRETGRSKGYGFVEMPNDDEARDAISTLNDSDLDGRTIIVKEATPREDRRGGGRGGYSNNRRSGGRDSGGYGRDRDRNRSDRRGSKNWDEY